MATERVDRSRITFEVDPAVRAFLEGWAKEEQRPLSNLVRRLISGIADKRMAARAGLTEIEHHVR
jgi:hypothetical protein